MKVIAKTIEVLTIILLLLNSFLFLGTVMTLLEQWVGTILSYILALIVAPILAPALLFLPWFDAWVTGEGVNEGYLVIWGAFVTYVLVRIVAEKWLVDQ